MNSRLNLAGRVDAVVAPGAHGAMMQHRGAFKWVALGAALVAALAMAPGASAHGRHGGHSEYRGGYGGHYVQPRYYNRGGYYRGGHWSGGRWIAGAIVTGAVIGLVSNAVAPPPVYYAPPVVYGPPAVYYPAPVVTRRVVEAPAVVYGDPYQTRYIRSDW